MGQSILIRGTNWIGDAIMTFPAIGLVHDLFPEARLHLIARPWVAPVYKCHPDIQKILVCQEGPGLINRLLRPFNTSKQIAPQGYSKGILFPNSFESALEFRIAGIPEILGYATDARRILLTRAVPIPEDKEKRHHIWYYLDLVKHLAEQGTQSVKPSTDIKLCLPEKELKKAETFLSGLLNRY
ncbi:MAG: hypothetical protein DSZ23_06335, partial [Thermodesulfatator sp.]